MRKISIAATISALTLSGALMTGVPAAAAPVGGVDANEPSLTAIVPGGAEASVRASREGGVVVQHLDGACNQYPNGLGDFCLWYYQGFSGSVADFFTNDCNMSNDLFVSPGAGQGRPVANNAESDWNYDLVHSARIFTDANCTGSFGDIGPGSGGNLTPTFRNNVEGFYFF